MEDLKVINYQEDGRKSNLIQWNQESQAVALRLIYYLKQIIQRYENDDLLGQFNLG